MGVLFNDHAWKRLNSPLDQGQLSTPCMQLQPTPTMGQGGYRLLTQACFESTQDPAHDDGFPGNELQLKHALRAPSNLPMQPC